MKRSLTILFGSMVVIFMFFGCQQPNQSSGKLEKFKSLHVYKLNDFHLVKDVKYFSIHLGFTGITYRYNAQTYQQLSSDQKHTLEDAKKEVKSYFNLYMPPNGMLIGRPVAYILYMDETSKVHTIETKDELKEFLGNIDTPAEVKVWLMLNGKRDVSSYKKGFVDYRAWFCDEASFSNAKCTYVVTPHGRIEEK
jgi:hypothetical protein